MRNELVAAFRLKGRLAAPKLNGLLGTPRREDRAAFMAGLPFGDAKFFCARLSRASAPEREGAEGSIDASDRARAGDTVESQPAKIQARTVRRYCEKIK